MRVVSVILGQPKRVAVSAAAANDMDLFVAVKKFDAQGNELQFRFKGDTR